jgi:two-component sensor histidine kinase
LNPLFVYTASVSGLGVGLLIWGATQLGSYFPDILLFMLLIFIAELTTSEVFAPQMAFSMSAAVLFASLLLFGPAAAVPVAAISGLMITMVAQWRQIKGSRSSLVQRALFNMAAHTVPAAVAGWVFVICGGQVGEVALLSTLLPLVLAAASFEFVNAALVVGAVSIQTKMRPFEIWKQNVSWAIPMNILSMVVGGGGLALGYQIAGLLGVGVFFLPLALTIYAFQMYVRRSKAQMEELESNIAERKQAEEQLRASLREKEVLLQEIHHRVKNNLQIMSSLLHLQSKQVVDEETLAMFQESRNRVRTMALVHEKLYQSSDLSKIDFAKYIRSLTSYLQRSYGVDPNTIRLETDAHDVQLAIDTAVPCGLIINELVTNSLQHAFPDGRKGVIRIEFQPNGESNYVLAVSDDGIGLPEEPDAGASETLGMQLVTTLVDQLEGSLEIKRAGGTRIEVTFTELAYDSKEQP